jgi:Ran GTPase-activating protein (RanGAP) involved in mRNA processing and transport
VTHLDLSENGLWRLTGAELAVAFTSLPAGVTHLDLSENGLWRLTGAELAVAFTSLPAGVTHLDLSWNDLGRLTGAEREEFIEVLLETGKAIQLEEPLATELRKAKSSKLEMYGTLFYESKIDLPDVLANEIFEFSYPKPLSL